jgi:hypothetical protein
MNTQTVERLQDLRHSDACRVDELFPHGGRIELFEAIVSGSPRAAQARQTAGGRRPRTVGGGGLRLRRPFVLSAVGAAAIGIVAAVLLSATSAVRPTPAEAVAFRTAASGDIFATVIEPFAAQAQLDAAFAKQGLKITVNLLPVSPSGVGTVLFIGESGSSAAQITPLQGGHCLAGGGGCTIGIKIPRDFTGEGSITLGRPAKPGEPYESSASIFAPGEPLHCSGLLGAKVAAALPVLRAKHLTVMQWREDIENAGVSQSMTDTGAPVQSYIWDAELIEPGKVRVTTESMPWPDDPGAGSGYNKGC